MCLYEGIHHSQSGPKVAAVRLFHAETCASETSLCGDHLCVVISAWWRQAWAGPRGQEHEFEKLLSRGAMNALKKGIR